MVLSRNLVHIGGHTQACTLFITIILKLRPIDAAKRNLRRRPWRTIVECIGLWRTFEAQRAAGVPRIPRLKLSKELLLLRIVATYYTGTALIRTVPVKPVIITSSSCQKVPALRNVAGLILTP